MLHLFRCLKVLHSMLQTYGQLVVTIVTDIVLEVITYSAMKGLTWYHPSGRV